MIKIKIGDIFELQTSKGIAYLYFVHKDSLTGEMIKVLPGLYNSLPANLSELAGQKELYLISFPLAAALKQQLIRIVSNQPVISFSKPKQMRTEHNVQGIRIGWHIIDTDTWQRQLVTALDSEQIKLSPWGIWNDVLLIEKLESGWKLEDWC